MGEYLIGFNCRGKTCNCDKTIIYYTKQLNDLAPIQKLLTYVKNGYIQKLSYCRIFNIKDFQEKEKVEILAQIINLNENQVEVICEKNDVFLQIPKTLFDACIDQLIQTMTLNIDETLEGILLNNIKDCFDSPVVKDWNIHIVNEIVQETVYEINN